MACLVAVGLVACSPHEASPTGGGGAPTSESFDQVQTFDDQGRAHIAPGVSQRYNSNPPTSGPHAPTVMAWGIHDRLSPKEVLVHNMEHGGVIVWYHCDGGPRPLSSSQCQELRTQLTRVVRTARDAKKLIVMGPYPEMERRIALTAWGKLDAFDEFDARRIARFIDTYERAFNPEGF